ncbi:MAG: glycogen debranching enzyme family protein [Tidjanibacter sp.]|nr:glycogen debranching enzyme family protein [Tidjanibacter sp.]
MPLTFDKNSLGNLEYSLQREMLSTDRAGGYMSTTIVCCNTRKYHGLIVSPINEEDKQYVLLSSLDETILYEEQPFNLAIHRYPNNYEPRGHKYIVDFKYTPTPTITYRVGGALIQKELLWRHSRSRLFIRYTLLEGDAVTLRLRPFLAFRDKHSLSKANMYADGHSYDIKGGVKCRLYQEFPWLNMQLNVESEFVAAPDWYYDFEYAEEYRRGYDYHEDLLTPGYFEMALTKERPVIFCGSVSEEIDPALLEGAFDEEIALRSNKVDFFSCLRHSARQFIVRHGDKTLAVAGYPWFGSWGRDTFISLPGITLAQGDVKSCLEVIDTMTAQMQDGMFPNVGSAYNSVDAPMWFVWCLQQLEDFMGKKEIWKRYGNYVKDILRAYRRGVGGYVALHTNGLIWASRKDCAMTWMDAVVDGKPVTGRDGYQVEINALWYNALCYAIDQARLAGDKEFVAEWKDEPAKTKESFLKLFWLDDQGYLADYVDDKGPNNFIRPNQIIACSVEYKMVNLVQQEAIADVVRRHLLTPKGLRTLSPRNPLYKGRYGGSQRERDLAYHQGTVWTWLLEHYVKAKFDVQGKGFIAKAEEILDGFADELNTYGIGSIGEIFDGDPPHHSRGSISQAWSVGAVLRIKEMVDKYKRKRK